MFTIWTTAHQSKVFHHFAPVLKSVPDLPIAIVKDYSVPEGTKVIMALGGGALKRLQDEKIVARNRAITSYRTIPLLRGNIPVMVSYSPDISEIDHGYYIDLLTDLSLAVRYYLTGNWKPVYGKYRYVTDFSELCAKIEAKHKETGQPVDISKDLETLGLDPYALPLLNPPYPGAYIVSMQATCEAGTADVIRFGNRLHEEHVLSQPEFREQINYLLNCPYIRLKASNFKYDTHWLAVRGHFKCSTFTFDTVLVGSLLDENRSNSLDIHTKIYIPALGGYADEFNRSFDKARMDLVPSETLLPYAGGDVDADLQVAAVQKTLLLQDPQLTSFYVNILHPAARAFEQIEQTGVLIDYEAFQELKLDLEKEHVRLVTEAVKIMGGRIYIKHRDTSRPGHMNLTKASMLIDYMFSPMGLNLKPKMFTEKPDKNGIQRPSTATEHLIMFEDHPDAKAFVAIIKEDSGVMKTYDTYVMGFLEHLRSDNRFHPTYFLYVGDKAKDEGGGRTGRLSAKDPAWQTLPKHTKWTKRIRRCYPAPNGYVIVELDYSQGELRVAACIAKEDHMIAAYQAGRDLHVETASVRWGMTYEELMALSDTDPGAFEEKRQPGKAGNFGLLFGMGVDGFINYARANYGVELPYEEAEAFRNGFFKKYPRLIDYHVKFKKLAHKDKQVRTPLGRIRHLPLIDSPNKEYVAKAERQAINCVDDETQMLTVDGWKSRQDIEPGRFAYSMNPATGCLELVVIEELHQGEYAGSMCQWDSNTFSALTTPAHCWLVSCRRGQKIHWEWEFHQSLNLHSGPDMKIPIAAAISTEEDPCITDDELTCLGWVVTDGHCRLGQLKPDGSRWNTTKVSITQKKPQNIPEIEALLIRLGYKVCKTSLVTGGFTWTWANADGQKYRDWVPNRELTPQFLSRLSARQIRVLLDAMIKGDGWEEGYHLCLAAGVKKEVADVWAIVGVLAGYAVTVSYIPPSENNQVYESIGYKIANTGSWIVRLKRRKFVHPQFGRTVIKNWSGIVWCPTLKYGNFVARREGLTFITGNSPVQGCLTDMVLWSLGIQNKMGLLEESPCFGSTHDSVTYYVQEDKVDCTVPQLLSVMENLPFKTVGWDPPLRFVADAKIGKHMGAMTAWKGKKK